jgi:hypothetical protein
MLNTAALVGVANRKHDDRAQPLDPCAGVLEVGTQGFRSGRGVLEGGFRSGVLTQAGSCISEDLERSARFLGGFRST